MVRHGAVPTHDTWSFTAPGGRWIPHSWLFQLAVYGAHSTAGVVGMVVFRVLLASTALFLLERTAALRGAPAALRLPVIGIAAALAAYRFSDRPQMFSFVLAAGALWSLERWALTAFGSDARQPLIARRLWWLVPAFWVWGNSHAGVIYGFGILGAYAVEALARRARGGLAWNPWRFAGFAAVCAAASLCGPAHVWTLLYPLVVLPKLRDAGFSVIEFMPEPAGTPGWQRYAVIGTALLWLALARRRPLREMLIVLGSAVLAFRWYRERAMFALLVSPFAVFLLDDMVRRMCRSRAPRSARASGPCGRHRAAVGGSCAHGCAARGSSARRCARHRARDAGGIGGLLPAQRSAAPCAEHADLGWLPHLARGGPASRCSSTRVARYIRDSCSRTSSASSLTGRNAGS